MSVMMTNCGPLGWVTDEARGYRYQATHPETGEPWPPIPDIVLKAWRELGGYAHGPQACLVNYYAPSARMGLHQDKDEQDFSAPVVSLSLGDTGLFRVGGTETQRSDARRCGLPPAMRSCSAAKAGSRSTASIAFCRIHRRCCPKADGST